MVTEGASSRNNNKQQPQKEHGIDCRASDSDHAFFSKRINEAAHVCDDNSAFIVVGQYGSIW